MTIILGINAYHGGASACLISDGQLIAAAEEERFTRIKYWAGFPVLAIGYCLREAGISVNDLDHIALAGSQCKSASESAFLTASSP